MFSISYRSAAIWIWYLFSNILITCAVSVPKQHIKYTCWVPLFQKNLVSEPSIAKQAETNQAVRRQTQNCCQKVLGGAGAAGHRNCWRQPREDIFQRAAKENEGDGKSDFHNMYVMVLCRHRCQNNSFQLKIENGHLSTNIRFFFILNQIGIPVRVQIWKDSYVQSGFHTTSVITS